MKLIEAICALLSPQKHLHGLHIQRQDDDTAAYADRNTQLIREAMDLAVRGYRVQLECTNRSWFKFTAEPSDECVFNGQEIRPDRHVN